MAEQQTDQMVGGQVSGAESEEVLLDRARSALSNCNWVVGECAAHWTEKYSRGRADADFGNLIGLSADQVFQRRRVWETFHDVRDLYPGLRWSHFYVSINWDDAAECLQWAVDNQATIAEMRAWRRSIHGEDLTVDPDPYALQALDYENRPVMSPAEREAGQRAYEDVPFDVDGSREYATAASAEATPYAPFRKDARGQAWGDEQDGAGETSSPPRAESTPVEPLRVIKRSIAQLRRIQQQLGELSDQDYEALTPEVLNQLWDVYEDLGTEIKRH